MVCYHLQVIHTYFYIMRITVETLIRGSFCAARDENIVLAHWYSFPVNIVLWHGHIGWFYCYETGITVNFGSFLVSYWARLPLERYILISEYVSEIINGQWLIKWIYMQILHRSLYLFMIAHYMKLPTNTHSTTSIRVFQFLNPQRSKIHLHNVLSSDPLIVLFQIDVELNILSKLPIDLAISTPTHIQNRDTVKPVCNDHLYNKMYYLWFIQ